MKRILFMTVIVMALAISMAQADVISVTANPLWTDTGIILDPCDVVKIHDAVGSWTWGSGWFGPEGDPQPGLAWDEWITNGLHGQLIGFIGGVPDLNAVPRVILQDDPRLFEIGLGSVALSGQTGKLWLGFNDDYASIATGDNFGSVRVQVDVACIPEPATIALIGSGLLPLLKMRRRRA